MSTNPWAPSRISIHVRDICLFKIEIWAPKSLLIYWRIPFQFRKRLTPPPVKQNILQLTQYPKELIIWRLLSEDHQASWGHRNIYLCLNPIWTLDTCTAVRLFFPLWNESRGQWRAVWALESDRVNWLWTLLEYQLCDFGQAVPRFPHPHNGGIISPVSQDNSEE